MSYTNISRRTFLSGIATSAAAAITVPRCFGSNLDTAQNQHNHILLLLQLQGGNDGLNTLAPIDDPIYRRARPNLALGSEAIELDRGLALHPALAPLAKLWKEKRLAFALGVGWAQPQRSHFKAQDQWATGTNSGEGTGWLARAYAHRAKFNSLVALDPSSITPIEGGSLLALQLGPAQMRGNSRFRQMNNLINTTTSPVLKRLIELELAGAQELDRLKQALPSLPVGLDLPRSSLGQQVKLALQLIGSGVCPPVLTLAHKGYDTHANQKNRHNRQLSQLAAGLTAFEAGLQQLTNRPDVTILAVSEFGRRLKENGYRGTDHGSASVALLLGDRVPAQFLGNYPNLEMLDARGDLQPNITPPELYEKVLSLR
ncbi:DUF1501 domain-containing protein [Synechococcus sp. MIT S9507]|uniref:DUF1501 domain-containing protein n=1 Tax=Synechococcus sp. MIT S9507 TaxID=3082544 RepID=UPI0039B374B4